MENHTYKSLYFFDPDIWDKNRSEATGTQQHTSVSNTYTSTKYMQLIKLVTKRAVLHCFFDIHIEPMKQKNVRYVSPRYG